VPGWQFVLLFTDDFYLLQAAAQFPVQPPLALRKSVLYLLGKPFQPGSLDAPSARMTVILSSTTGQQPEAFSKV
jgi:hypothetical protein